MPTRPSNAEEAAEIFRIFARTQCAGMPIYERFSHIFADSKQLTSLILIPPFAQRLPALILSAFHFLALQYPDDEVATIFPSLYPNAGDVVKECTDRELRDIFLRCVNNHELELQELLETRALQTNEVNRSCAWRYALHTCPLQKDKPYSLVELGSSAGLNLSWDHYRMAFITQGDPLSMSHRLACLLKPPLPRPNHRDEHGDSHSTSHGDVLNSSSNADDGDGEDDAAGDNPDSTVADDQFLMELATSLNDTRNLPHHPVERIGIDQHPLDANDVNDARWLQACVWPEQTIRFGRMHGAIEDAKDYPPNLVPGDYRKDLVDIVSTRISDEHDLVVLSSWALAYVSSEERRDVLEQLRGLAMGNPGKPRRIFLCTLEPARAFSWLDTTAIQAELGDDFALGSVLARTEINPDGSMFATVLGHGQAHMNWFQPIRKPVQTQPVD